VSWAIVKKGYSRSPWRIVNGDGIEIATVCSETGIHGPVCGQTKAELVEWLLDRCEWYATHAINGLIPPVYTKNWRNPDKLDGLQTERQP